MQNQEELHLKWSEWKDPKRVIEVYGVGLLWYQKYQYSLILLDLALSVFALFPIVAHAVEGSLPYAAAINSTSSSSAFSEAVFVMVTASYAPASLKWVYFYMVSHLICITIHPICYSLYLHKNHPANNIAFEDPWDHSEFHLRGEDHAPIKDRAIQILPIVRVPSIQEQNALDKANRIEFHKIFRNSLSVLCFLCVLCAYGICLWGLQIGMYDTYLINASKDEQLSAHIWISIVLSIVQACTDLVWMIVSELIRFVEVHDTQDSFEKWQCSRLFLLRVFSINMFYAIRTWILVNEEECSAGFLGVQHLFIVISYIFGDLLADYIWPALYRAYHRWRGNFVRDYETWYEFLLSEQYATVSYRHILLSCGASFIPGLSIIALLGNCIQLKSDQYRLTRLCRIRHRLYSSYNHFVQILGVFTVLCYLLAFPKGVLFLFIDSNSFFTCDMLSSN